MDIKAKITEIVNKIKNDSSLMEKFKTNPTAVIEELIGVDLPDEQINKIVEGVKAKIGVDKVSGIAGKLSGLFKKK